MFNVLVVDDSPEIRNDLSGFFKQCAPDFNVEFAESISGGFRAIDLAKKRRTPFDAGVLDFKLPQEDGGTANIIDESLCMAMSPDAFVVHITMHLEQELIDRGQKLDLSSFDFDLQKMLKHQLWHARTGKPGVIFSKLGADYADRLLQALREALYNRLVRGELDDVFGRESGGAGSARRGLQGSSDLMYDLAGLKEDIEAGWPYLEDDVKTRVRRLMRIDK